MPKILYYYPEDIIIFIFLIAGVCASLPALVWSLWIIYKHHKNGGEISAIILLLLLNDLLELLLSLFIVSYLFFDNNKLLTFNYIQCSDQEYWWDYDVHILVNAFWSTLKIGGLYLHQLVALQSVLSVKNPTCSAQIFSPSCSIHLSIILWLVLFGCQFLMFKLVLNLVLCVVPVCILAVTWKHTCKVSPHHDRMKTGSAVLIVSALTLFAVCVPSITVYVHAYQRKPRMDVYYMNISNMNISEMNINDRNIYVINLCDAVSAFLVSMRVVSDPLLCVLLCKQKVRIHSEQSHTELNTDHQSV